MPYTPDALDDTQPIGSVVPASTAAAEFRAIKTKLIEHETAITDTLPDAITAIADDLAAISSPKNRQVLTGSGNFTVPAAVTTLYISICAGGLAGYTASRSSPGTSYTLEVDPRPGRTSAHILTVTPAQVIAYSIGVNEEVSRSGLRFTQDVAPTDSTFGDFTSRCERIRMYRSDGDATTGLTDDLYPVWTETQETWAGIRLNYEPNLVDSAIDGYGAHIIVEW